MENFSGFELKDLDDIFNQIGYKGDVTNLNDFLATNPNAAGTFAKLLNDKFSDKPAFAAGGSVTPPTNTQPQNSVAPFSQASGSTMNEVISRVNPGTAENARRTTAPGSMAQPVNINPQSNQFISSNTGQVNATSLRADTVTPTPINPNQPAQGYTASTAAGAVNQLANNTNAVQGAVSANSQVTAAQGDPNKLSQLGLQAPQLARAQTVQDPGDRQVSAGELVSGSSVNMSEVDRELGRVQGVTGEVQGRDTVQGQMSRLQQDFAGGQTPAWAAGALRNAEAAMAARGLSSSSIAGQALVQAALEASIPIAQADAATFAAFSQANLNRQQQAALLAAEQRATFLGQKFDQNFQTRVLNANRIAEAANMSYNKDVTIALENAQLAQSVDLANLNTRSAKVLSDAAAMSQMDMTNLNNRQQAQVVNAQAFLQMDLSNLEARQQNQVMEFQARTNALLSDQAQTNAARQFNAQSENQMQQFFGELAANVDIARATMTNEGNQFNATLRNQREQFNATNRLTIASANTAWRRQISTTNNATQNLVNQLNAATISRMNENAFNAMIQLERDEMSYVDQALARAFQGGENAAQRATEVMLAAADRESREELTRLGYDFEAGAAVGQLVYNGIGALVDWFS